MVVGAADTNVIDAAVVVTGAADTVKPRVLLTTAVVPTVELATTLSAPICVPAFSDIVATPDALVSAVPPVGKNTPKPVACVVNFTTAPATGVPAASFSVAVSVAGVLAEIAVVDALSVRVATAGGGGVTVPPPEPVPPVTVPLLPPPQAASNVMNTIDKRYETVLAAHIFNLDSSLPYVRLFIDRSS